MWVKRDSFCLLSQDIWILVLQKISFTQSYLYFLLFAEYGNETFITENVLRLIPLLFEIMFMIFCLVFNTSELKMNKILNNYPFTLKWRTFIFILLLFVEIYKENCVSFINFDLYSQNKTLFYYNPFCSSRSWTIFWPSFGLNFGINFMEFFLNFKTNIGFLNGITAKKISSYLDSSCGWVSIDPIHLKKSPQGFKLAPHLVVQVESIMQESEGICK